MDPTFPISLPPIPLAYQDLLLRSFGSFTEEEEEGWERTLPVKAGGGGGGKRARAILFSRARGCDGGAISQKNFFFLPPLVSPFQCRAAGRFGAEVGAAATVNVCVRSTNGVGENETFFLSLSLSLPSDSNIAGGAESPGAIPPPLRRNFRNLILPVRGKG